MAAKVGASLVVLAWCGAAQAALTLGWPTAVRLPLLLGVVTACPGMAFVGLLRIPGRALQLTLALALSLGLAILLPTALLYAHLWSPMRAIWALLLVSEAGAALRLVAWATGGMLPLAARFAAGLRRLLALLGGVPYAWAVVTNVGSIVATAGLTSVLGFAYWVVAARGFSPGEVGLASSSISAMMILGLFGGMGMSTLLIGQFPRHPGREGNLLITGLAVSAAGGGLLGALFGLVAPIGIPELGVLRASGGALSLFAAGVAVTSSSLVLDSALIGLLLGHVQLARNAVLAIVKLAAVAVAALAVSAQAGGLAIYATWLFGNLVSLGSLGAWALARGVRPASIQLELVLFRDLSQSALKHHALNLALQVPTLGLPVVVTAVLGAQANAYFYVAWTMAYLVFVGPLAFSNVLYAVGLKDRRAVPRQLRFSLGLSLVAAVATGAALIVLGRELLLIFGHRYSTQATVTLEILTLTAVPSLVKYHYVALARIRDQVGRGGLVAIGGAVLEVGLAVAGGLRGGLELFTAGWGIALAVEAVAVLPWVLTPVVPLPHAWGAGSQCRALRRMAFWWSRLAGEPQLERQDVA